MKKKASISELIPNTLMRRTGSFETAPIIEEEKNYKEYFDGIKSRVKVFKNINKITSTDSYHLGALVTEEPHFIFAEENATKITIYNFKEYPQKGALIAEIVLEKVNEKYKLSYLQYSEEKKETEYDGNLAVYCIDKYIDISNSQTLFNNELSGPYHDMHNENKLSQNSSNQAIEASKKSSAIEFDTNNNNNNNNNSPANKIKFYKVNCKFTLTQENSNQNNENESKEYNLIFEMTEELSKDQDISAIVKDIEKSINVFNSQVGSNNNKKFSINFKTNNTVHTDSKNSKLSQPNKKNKLQNNKTRKYELLYIKEDELNQHDINKITALTTQCFLNHISQSKNEKSKLSEVYFAVVNHESLSPTNSTQEKSETSQSSLTHSSKGSDAGEESELDKHTNDNTLNFQEDKNSDSNVSKIEAPEKSKMSLDELIAKIIEICSQKKYIKSSFFSKKLPNPYSDIINILNFIKSSRWRDDNEKLCKIYRAIVPALKESKKISNDLYNLFSEYLGLQNQWKQYLEKTNLKNEQKTEQKNPQPFVNPIQQAISKLQIEIYGTTENEPISEEKQTDKPKRNKKQVEKEKMTADQLIEHGIKMFPKNQSKKYHKTESIHNSIALFIGALEVVAKVETNEKEKLHAVYKQFQVLMNVEGLDPKFQTKLCDLLVHHMDIKEEYKKYDAEVFANQFMAATGRTAELPPNPIDIKISKLKQEIKEEEANTRTTSLNI